MTAPSLASDVRATMRLLAHEESVRREFRAREARERPQTPGSVALGVGRMLLWIATRTAPFLLVARGYAQVRGWRDLCGSTASTAILSMVLHLLCLLYLDPRGLGELRGHEAMRMPGRRSLLLASWMRWLPRAFLVGAAFGVYQASFSGIVGSWVPSAWMGALPLLLGILATWWQVREPSSPECRFTGRLLRAALGGFVLISLGASWGPFLNGNSFRRLIVVLVPFLAVVGWGLLLVWFGLRDLGPVLRSVRGRSFRFRVVATDLVALSLLLVAAALTIPSVVVAGTDFGDSWYRGMRIALAGTLILEAWVVLVTLWLHRTREFPGLAPRSDAGLARHPEEEERRSSFGPALLRGPSPRGFAAAWNFRRRASMAPAVPWMFFGFMAFCIWISFVDPEAAFAGVIGVLLFPTYVGFGISSRLQLLGVGYREQHVQNLRALGWRVALPAAAMCGLLLGVFEPSRGRWEAIGLVASALVLRVGVAGYWRWFRHHGIRVGLSVVLVTIVFLPMAPTLLGFEAWFRLSNVNLTAFYGAMGCAGLVLHLATLDEGYLRDEMRREAERTAAMA